MDITAEQKRLKDKKIKEKGIEINNSNIHKFYDEHASMEELIEKLNDLIYTLSLEKTNLEHRIRTVCEIKEQHILLQRRLEVAFE